MEFQSLPEYQQTLNYPAYLLYRLGQITTAIDFGKTGFQELKTLWNVLIPEVKDDLREDFDKRVEELYDALGKEPSGTIWVTSAKRYIPQNERIQSLENQFVEDMIGKIIAQLHRKRLLLMTGKQIEIGGTY